MRSCNEFQPVLIKKALVFKIPHLEIVRAVMRLAWACAGGNMKLLIESTNWETLHECLKDNEPDEDDIAGG